MGQERLKSEEIEGRLLKLRKLAAMRPKSRGRALARSGAGSLEKARIQEFSGLAAEIAKKTARAGTLQVFGREAGLLAALELEPWL
jgi:hypothetical protein